MPASDDLFQQALLHAQNKNWLAARTDFEVLLSQTPEHSQAWNNLGNVRDAIEDYAGALAAYRQALALNPDYRIAAHNLAMLLYQEGTRRYQESTLDAALVAFQEAAELAFAHGMQTDSLASYDHSLLQVLLETCAMDGALAQLELMRQRFEVCVGYWLHPYPVLAASDDPVWHLEIAKRFAVIHHPQSRTNSSTACDTHAHKSCSPATGRIRVAYLSADWHEHPIAQLLTPVLEQHDRQRFEVFVVAIDQIADTSPLRHRLTSACDHFLSLGHLSDAQIATELRSLNLDIAIDLSLYMELGRPTILADRPARVQAQWLGFPGSSGAPWVNVVIADAQIAPFVHAHFFSEKIYPLPQSYLPAHAERPHADLSTLPSKAILRQQLGLPENTFIFCAFNNPYKITRPIFDIWLSLLQQLPNAALLLPELNPYASKNLRQAAKAMGLHTQLLFAPRVKNLSDHLLRYAACDLFLDTFPYNAHSTAQDALWMALPVLTLQGQSFASRVGTSFAFEFGLPELVTTTLTTYETTALRLAQSPDELAAIQARLASPLQRTEHFDVVQFTKGLERILENMQERSP